MPVDTRHKSYEKHRELWERCSDAVRGRKAVKEAGEKYLSAIGGQNRHSDYGEESDDYQSYKKRALWYNASARTHQALVGMVFRKDPSFQFPEGMGNIVENITLDGETLTQFSRNAFSEVMQKGRGGILVDHPPQDDSGVVTKAEAESAGIRPYMSFYKTESIVNWSTSQVRGKKIVDMVVLKERYSGDGGDKFTDNKSTQYRVLELANVDEFEGAVYRVQIYRQNDTQDGDDDWYIAEETVPRKNGSPLNQIPFVFLGVDGTTPSVDKPPMLDLVNVNFSHYRNSASYEHGLFFTSLPTAVITGVQENRLGEEWFIGSRSAWMFTDPDADAKYLEYEGKGLGEIKQAMDSKEEMMAFLGARMLTPEKREAEAKETAQIRHSGEQSIVGTIANSVSDGITQAMRILAEWNGNERDSVSVTLNTDFMPTQMDAQEIKAHMELWLNNAIAFDDLIHNLQQGEVIREDRESGEIKDDMQQESKPILGEM